MIKALNVIVALALALLMMVTISVAPALANDDRTDRLLRKDIQLDRQILHELRHDDFGCCHQFDRDHHGFIVVSPFVVSPFVLGCWEWDGDEWELDDDCD